MQHGDAFEGGDVEHNLLSSDGNVEKALGMQFQHDRKRESVERSQPMREAVFSQQTCGGKEMVGTDGDEFDFSSGDIDQQARALETRRGTIHAARANLACEH